MKTLLLAVMFFAEITSTMRSQTPNQNRLEAYDRAVQQETRNNQFKMWNQLRMEGKLRLAEARKAFETASTYEAKSAALARWGDAIDVLQDIYNEMDKERALQASEDQADSLRRIADALARLRR